MQVEKRQDAWGDGEHLGVIHIRFSFSLLGKGQKDHLARRSVETWRREERNETSHGELQELLKLAGHPIQLSYMDFQHWLLSLR